MTGPFEIAASVESEIFLPANGFRIGIEIASKFFSVLGRLLQPVTSLSLLKFNERSFAFN